MRERDLARPRQRRRRRPARRPTRCGAARGTAARPSASLRSRRCERLDRGRLQRFVLATAPAGCRESARRASTCRCPAGPTISRLWPPAAAISSARLALLLALDVAQVRIRKPSALGGQRSSARDASGASAGEVSDHTSSKRARRQDAAPPRPARPRGALPRAARTRARSPACAPGHRERAAHRTQLAGQGQLARELVPGERARPAAARWRRGCRVRSAGRSGPNSLGRSAGARFTVMRRAGNSKCAVLKRRAHAVARLPSPRFRASRRWWKLRQAIGQVRLDA